MLKILNSILTILFFQFTQYKMLLKENNIKHAFQSHIFKVRNYCVTNFGSWSLVVLYIKKKCVSVIIVQVEQHRVSLLGCLFQEKIFKMNFILIYSSLTNFFSFSDLLIRFYNCYFGRSFRQFWWCSSHHNFHYYSPKFNWRWFSHDHFC